MKKAAALLLVLSGAMGAVLLNEGHVSQAQGKADVQWIWHNEGEGLEFPGGTRYFRRVLNINRPVQIPVDEATLDITADDNYSVWINGKLVGKGDTWKTVSSYDVTKLLVHGDNIIAVEATNTSPGAAGLLVRLGYVPNGYSKMALTSDGSWLSSKTADKGWQELNYKITGWTAVRVLGGSNSVGPWKDLVWGKGGNSRFTVPENFKVEEAVKIPATDPNFSLINMTFDDKGRLLVSREQGPTLLCTGKNKDGVCEKVQVYCEQVKNSQGMCWVKGALLLVGNGPKGTGLYRCVDKDGDDKVDEVTLLHEFKGSMSEHGPHAIIHGPDDWLYVVIGNHAWAKVDKLAKNSPLTRWPTGDMGPDQGKPKTTEDVLLPRLNDARNHAANILAPGGTIWRMDHNGKNISLVSAGYRNHFDAAFSPSGELFTYDSDMEWDEALPWYRAVRVCHATPGSDFVWRTGAANTPDYYLDSLPPTAETGRGSPVGVEFYDHRAFPAKYRGAFFACDWAIGVIFAVHLERDGASYKSKVEKFCVGAPMNVTDCAVGADGALYFTLGGRGTQGGVYRIVYTGKDTVDVPGQKQPLAAFSRKDKQPLVATPEGLKAENPELRARAVYLAGVYQTTDRDGLLAMLKDKDALVRRRTCEALIRADITPPVKDLWPLLGDTDRFVQHAARLVLERIDPKDWFENIAAEKNDTIALQSIVALCHTDKVAVYSEPVFNRLRGVPVFKDDPKKPVTEKDYKAQLDHLRTLQLALIHTAKRPIWTKGLAEQCYKIFPSKDARVNRELAIVLTQFQREGHLDEPIQAKMLAALAASKDDRAQQIHYAYCMRLLTTGWTVEQKAEFAAWYNTTQSWKGGHSFTPFLENIFRETLAAFDANDRKQILAQAAKLPLPTLVLLQRLQTENARELLPALTQVPGQVADFKTLHRGVELQQALGDVLAKTALQQPSAATWPLLLYGLDSKNPLLRADVLTALQKLDKSKPKIDDPAPFRSVLKATPAMTSPKDRWAAVQLLRQWTGRNFGNEMKQVDAELSLWARWYNQSFPKEAALPTAADKTQPSKHDYAKLLAFLDKAKVDGKGNAANGRKVFEKANCLKCHKFGKEGEGVGPDLTTLSQRFKRSDMLDAIVAPSKVISDQYRSVTITTKNGQFLTGLASTQDEVVNVLLSDASKLTLKRSDIEEQVASLVSVMPELLLDPLSPEEIADLFAFLESAPKLLP